MILQGIHMNSGGSDRILVFTLILDRCLEICIENGRKLNSGGAGIVEKTHLAYEYLSKIVRKLVNLVENMNFGSLITILISEWLKVEQGGAKAGRSYTTGM